MAAKRYFVTGTDTEVGKTLVSSAILTVAGDRGLRTLAMKPIAAGAEQIDGQWRNDDALELQAAMNSELPYAQLNPVCLPQPIAPHIAARDNGQRLSADRVVGFCRGVMMQPTDLLIIEGAGGWRVPLNERETFADVPKALGLDVILVVGLRLGCLNHALLTAEAIERDGLRLAGWVGSCIDPDMDSQTDNIDDLKMRLRAPCLGIIPHLSEPDAASAGKFIDIDVIV